MRLAKCARTRNFFLASTQRPKGRCALTRYGGFFILMSWRAMLGLSKTIFPAWELNFEFLVLCCMQPLGCVMCKKHCNYRETFGAM